jgi:hypothetical protein
MSSDTERTLRKRRSNVSKASTSTDSHDAHRGVSPAAQAKESIPKPLKQTLEIASRGQEQLMEKITDTAAFVLFLSLDVLKTILTLLKQPM